MTETPERTALERIKALAAGERAPNWAGDRNTYATRCHILDICDAALSSSFGEPVSQEAPLPDTLIKQSRRCNMCDRPEVCDRILPNTGPCGMNDGTPVISSASPLSEEERSTAFIAFIGKGENSLGRYPANLTELAAAVREFDRIAGSAQ